MEADQGKLTENIVLFARALRAAGLRVGPGAISDALEAIMAAGLGSREDLYWMLHAVFVKRHEDRTIFDQAFRLFWRKRALLERLMATMMPVAPAPHAKPEEKKAGGARIAEAMFQGSKAEAPKPKVEIDARLSVSDREILQRKDFEQMTTAEIAQAKRLMRELVLPLDRVRTRRLTRNPRGHIIDPRGTLRASLRSGGAFIDLKRLGPQHRYPPLVALCDISGSMSQYTRMVLHFLHALMEARRRVHVFLFGTRLSNVTRQLRARDPDEALARVTGTVADWAGGTRIATSLHNFNRDWSRRVLGQGAVVLLMTDGLERDPEGDLARETERLRKSCRRLIWVNPLLRFEGFEAKARGVRLMLPHVDEFRPVHNLESMAALVDALSERHARDADPRRWLARLAA
ncbi:MAG: VWA domain-containing protein [Pseudomonadota bacterium]|nr:VWA domain-containing protein [Pseudomonadota bacterium]